MLDSVAVLYFIFSFNYTLFNSLFDFYHWRKRQIIPPIIRMMEMEIEREFRLENEKECVADDAFAQKSNNIRCSEQLLDALHTVHAVHRKVDFFLDAIP